MVDYHKCFIENMKFYRKQKGISQAQLAEACDVSNGTIGNIECGITKPSFDLILLIAEKLEIKPETLFYSEESTIPPVQEFDKLTKDQLKKIKSVLSSALKDVMLNLQDL